MAKKKTRTSRKKVKHAKRKVKLATKGRRVLRKVLHDPDVQDYLAKQKSLAKSLIMKAFKRAESKVRKS